MKDSLIILMFFVVGIAIGLLGVDPTTVLNGQLSFYALCALMFFVGLSIGSDTQIWEKFKTLNKRMLLLPLLTIVGTLLGTALVSLLLSKRSLFECMAVGSGMGYYSLSSIFISEYKGLELGTVALMSNIMRELMALLLAPFFVKYFGKLAPISVGGATTMDTTMPIILKFSGKEFAVISIFHGFLTDLSVPFLVTLFCSL